MEILNKATPGKQFKVIFTATEWTQSNTKPHIRTMTVHNPFRFNGDYVKRNNFMLTLECVEEAKGSLKGGVRTIYRNARFQAKYFKRDLVRGEKIKNGYYLEAYENRRGVIIHFVPDVNRKGEFLISTYDAEVKMNWQSELMLVQHGEDTWENDVTFEIDRVTVLN